MRALITGAGGFVGWHLAMHLADCGDTFLGLERPANPARHDQSLAAAADQPAIRWDLREALPASARTQIVDFDPDAIYHLAAISIPADCGQVKPSAEAQAVNVHGTERVLALAASLKPAPRVLVVSSAYVYAPVDPKSPIVNENSALAPPNPYGLTKLAAEELTHAAAQRGLPVIIARAFNHTGPGQSDRLMLPEWCRKFAAGDDPVVVQCRDAWLDIIDVRDVVRAYRLLMERGRSGEVYNVGGGVPRRSGDLLAQLAQLADPHRRIREEQPGRRQQPIADISRLTAATGWKLEIDLKTTIADTLAYWHRAAASSRQS